MTALRDMPLGSTIESLMGQKGVLLATSPHPVHEGFMLAVWELDGHLSFDALSPRQEFQIVAPAPGERIDFAMQWAQAVERVRNR